ncbi:hypothetical protein C8F01DRAFT_1369371 [Mycena amicta]|nr:hypothetical protein C8F01DRAFT_1369371 [Mycena amicta]
MTPPTEDSDSDSSAITIPDTSDEELAAGMASLSVVVSRPPKSVARPMSTPASYLCTLTFGSPICIHLFPPSLLYCPPLADRSLSVQSNLFESILSLLSPDLGKFSVLGSTQISNRLIRIYSGRWSQRSHRGHEAQPPICTQGTVIIVTDAHIGPTLTPTSLDLRPWCRALTRKAASAPEPAAQRKPRAAVIVVVCPPGSKPPDLLLCPQPLSTSDIPWPLPRPSPGIFRM